MPFPLVIFTRGIHYMLWRTRVHHKILFSFIFITINVDINELIDEAIR
nr:MAG TPA: hypothetical protein [Caudoviricetes sp.]